jgi:hypothetical protein
MRMVSYKLWISSAGILVMGGERGSGGVSLQKRYAKRLQKRYSESLE